MSSQPNSTGHICGSSGGVAGFSGGPVFDLCNIFNYKILILSGLKN